MTANKIWSEEELYELFGHEYPIAPLLTEDEAEEMGLSQAMAQWATLQTAAQQPMIRQTVAQQQPIIQHQPVAHQQPIVQQQPVVQHQPLFRTKPSPSSQ
ncbi:hypothetical protein LA080_016306 [Diaporthe eres]|uniref:Uncharacterized protein n=1 Tax=Diaporthe vaccinii TaxID=105482 RepID=A0ABR4DZG4_9PEZI|nr:hypothetical protein LA080_016306 [Diaporthe eres]